MSTALASTCKLHEKFINPKKKKKKWKFIFFELNYLAGYTRVEGRWRRREMRRKLKIFMFFGIEVKAIAAYAYK